MKSTLIKGVDRDINNRAVFNSLAKIYDKIRPLYPEELFNTLIRNSHLSDDARILEIGPGTGQATIPMAKRGYNILAIELGEDLANIAKKRLRTYSNVRIIVDTFENAKLDSESFDLVYSATAFHWIKPEFKYKKTFRILKPGGYLAEIQTNHVSGIKDDSFFKATQSIYDRYMPSKKIPSHTLLDEKDLKPTSDLDTKLFKLVSFDCFPLVITYASNDYIDLISTYSSTLALTKEKSDKFLKEMKKLIKADFNNRVIKHYSMSLMLLRKI